MNAVDDTPELLQTQAPTGPQIPPGLAASVAFGRLLRLHPNIDITTIRFTIEPGHGQYAEPGPYVVARGTHPGGRP